MRYGNVPGIEKPVARVVQGTVMLSTTKVDENFRLLDAVFEAGGNAFDSAYQYGIDGECERVLGRWVKERGVRDQVVIITKGAHHDAHRHRVTPSDITSDLSESLERLQVDTVDLYLLHRDDPSVPVGPIVECLHEHLQAGRVRAYGGSNWSYDRIRAANEYAAVHGLTPFVASSPNFSLAEQMQPPWEGCITISGPENEEARAWYAERDFPLFTWSSLAGGFFSGRFTRDNLDTFEDYFGKLVVDTYCNDANFQRLDRARELAAEKELTLPQIALAYVLSQPLNIFALVGSETGEEFRDNVVAADVRLTEAEMAWLDLKRDDRTPQGTGAGQEQETT